MSTSPVLSVKDLNVRFNTENGVVHAVRGVNFDLYPGKTLGIVGESGSGKSVASMAIMGLHPTTADITGSIKYNGTARPSSPATTRPPTPAARPPRRGSACTPSCAPTTGTT